MLRSSHKVLTLRLGSKGYVVSPGNLRGGTWNNWPAGAADEDMEARLAVLKIPEASTCSQLDVVLDSALTRVQVVRIPTGIRKPAERTAFLKAAFRNVFGRDAGDWHVIAEQSYVNEPVPAVAIDENLMAAVSAFSARHGLKLRSLRTSFVDTFNSLRRKLSAHHGAFALLENGRICIGLWRNRNWIALTTQAFAAADGVGLAALSTQMLSRIEPPMLTGTLYIVGAESPFAVPLNEGWITEWLAVDPAQTPQAPQAPQAPQRQAATSGVA